MRVFYEVWHKPQDYCSFSDSWSKEDYKKFARGLAGKFGKISMEIGNNNMCIEILGREKGETKNMPDNMRKYLLSKGMEVTEMFKVKDLGAEKLERMEEEARDMGKTILPIATNPRDRSSIIRYWEKPYTG